MKPDRTTIEGNITACNIADDRYVRLKESKMSDKLVDWMNPAEREAAIAAKWAEVSDENSHLKIELSAQSSRERALVEAARTFVERCERGEIRSRKSYATFKAALAAYEDFK